MATSVVYDDLGFDGGGISYPLPDQQTADEPMEIEISDECLQTAEMWNIQYEFSCLWKKFDHLSKSCYQTMSRVLVRLVTHTYHFTFTCSQLRDLNFFIGCRCIKQMDAVQNSSIGEIKEKATMIQSRLQQIDRESLDDFTLERLKDIEQCLSWITFICEECVIADFKLQDQADRQQTAETWKNEFSYLRKKFDHLSKSYNQAMPRVLVMLVTFMCKSTSLFPQPIQSFGIWCRCNELKDVVQNSSIGEIKEKATMLNEKIQSHLDAHRESLNDFTTECREQIEQCNSCITSICDECLMADFIKQKLARLVTYDRELKLPCWSGAKAVVDIPSTSCCSIRTLCIMLSHASKFKENMWISKDGIPMVAKATGMSEDKVKEHFCYPQTGDGKDTLKPLVDNGLIRFLFMTTIEPNQEKDNLSAFFTLLPHNPMISKGEVFMLCMNWKGKSIGHCLPCVILPDKPNIVVCGCDGHDFEDVSSLSVYVLEKEPFAKLIDLPTDSDA